MTEYVGDVRTIMKRVCLAALGVVVATGLVKACIERDKAEQKAWNDDINRCHARTCPSPMSSSWEPISFTRSGIPMIYDCVCRIVPR